MTASKYLHSPDKQMRSLDAFQNKFSQLRLAHTELFLFAEKKLFYV